jgi:adenylate cyclase
LAPSGPWERAGRRNLSFAVGEGNEDTRWKRLGAQLRKGADKVDSSPALLTAAKLVRQMLPGDSRYGDPLSTAGSESPQVLGRRLAQLTEKRPGAMREAGMGALQMWQAVSEAQGRGRGETELTVVFTDLSNFSDWALEAGDEQALDLLRDVGQAIEPPVTDNGGRVVKRLGDGMMAVFPDAADALAAVQAGRDNLREVDCDGYEPKLRAGLHTGKPRKIGGDYLGVDVNIAARLAENAGADEILVSERVLEKLGDTDGLDVKKKRRFKVKGVPKDMTAHVVR